MRLAYACLGLTLVTALPAAVQAQEIRFPPPSLRLGEFRADVRLRMHFDFKGLDTASEVESDTFVFRRARLALEGRIYDDLEYEIDAELRDRERPWRDLIVNYRRFEAFEIQGGRFKVPFNLDQLTSVFSNNFVSRSLIGSQLSPGRDRGVMVHGSLANQAATYQAGWFQRDGDNVRFSEDLPANQFVEEHPVDGSWAGRIELNPWRRLRNAARRLQLGVNATFGEVGEGLFGLRGRTVGGFEFFEPVYVRGQRTRFGVDGRWTPGPFSVQAEYNRVTDERNGQGLGDVDLPNVVAQGWYLAGTWLLTGDEKAGGVEARRPFPHRGPGAVEVAARIEELRFGSSGTAGEPPFANPRAANIMQNRDRVLTFGVTWYLNQFGRVMWNAVRESIQDPMRSPILDKPEFWTGVVRLQFVM